MALVFCCSTAHAQTYVVSGTITANGEGLVGVNVTIGSSTATTDSSGNYTISGVAAGSITITPSLYDYSFIPSSISATVSTANLTGEDFTATESGGGGNYSISGTITLNGSGLSGVTVTAGSATATTNSSGDYTITGLAAGSYTLTPSLSGYIFNPATLSATISSANLTGENFTATVAPPVTYTISGTITLNGQGLSGVTVSCSAGSATTNSSGAYTISNVTNGSFTMTPSKSGYTFTPGSLTATVSSGNVSNENFTATAIPNTYTVSGTITLGSAPLAGVVVSDGTYTATTNASGSYSFSGVNGTYTLMPSLVGYVFAPVTQQVTVSGQNVSGVNFTAIQVVKTPAFSPAPGTYSSLQTVTITCATSGATIYYTTNGTTPTASSTKYTAAVSIAASTLLQAIAITNGMANSLVSAGVYTITGSNTYVSNTNTDTDGNGYPDEIKTALGISLTNPASTPLNMPANMAPGTLTLTGLSVRLNFAQTTGNDVIALSGALAIPANFASTGQTVVLDVGGVVKIFTLDSNGAGTAATGYPAVTSAANDRFKLYFNSVEGRVAAQTGKFVARFNKGTFAGTLADEGLLGNATITLAQNVIRMIPVIILFDGQMFESVPAVLYTATAGENCRAHYNHINPIINPYRGGVP
jgi:inhibitor of cysteine peptidase